MTISVIVLILHAALNQVRTQDGGDDRSKDLQRFLNSGPFQFHKVQILKVIQSFAGLAPCGVRHELFIGWRIEMGLILCAADENIPHEEVFRGCPIFGIVFDSWLAQQGKEIDMRYCLSVASLSNDY